MTPPASLAGEVAVVTGASSGIGAATARELGRRHCRVVLAARRADDLVREASRINDAGGDAVPVPTDVTNRADLTNLVAVADATYGRIDVLVNNAGSFWRRALVDSDPTDLGALVELNLLAPMILTQAVLPGMLERRHGALVFVGSLSGRVAMEPVYSATKFGLRGFALALRRQLFGTGVSVSLVTPGNIRTEMTSHVEAVLPEPQIVADVICAIVGRPRREVIVPARHKAIALLEDVAPALADLAYRTRGWSPVESPTPNTTRRFPWM